jgi:phenylacetate-coenzyme A ligase PaaK-like adenylate-forming protein
MYGSSEGGLMAMQDWHKTSLAFIPDTNFFEFIPEEQINAEHPRTVLIDEVQEGKAYELVLTNFYGMPFARYRQGDLVRIVRGDTVNGGVPRMEFLGRADDTIDLFGISRINTGVVSEALNNIGINAPNWCLHKNYESGKIFLDFYIESTPELSSIKLEQPLSKAIRKVDRHWGEAVVTMSYNPIRINLLQQGAFQKLGFNNNGNSPSNSILRNLW